MRSDWLLFDVRRGCAAWHRSHTGGGTGLQVAEVEARRVRKGNQKSSVGSPFLLFLPTIFRSRRFITWSPHPLSSS